MQNPAQVRGIFSAIAGRYDLANHLLSGGLDFLWRARAVRLVAAWQPGTILDLATGSGDLALAMQKAMPAAHVVGADFCLPMLQEAARKGLRPLVVADGTQLPFADASFDAVTVAFGLRNMASWPAALREMSRVLRPGGHLLVLDFSMPHRPLAAPYRFYLHKVLPFLAGLLTGHRAGYEYLGESIENFPSGEAMCSLVRSHGFAEAAATPLAAGIVSIYTARK
ncbi:MAG: ubiquinone/menaquinone biosynthesis methyltransferase [Chthoniobacterales bacterium]|jgi:demethylmenaquinone methyltransferase/2-methoxy-6-polyprenyl-1,4-benzoquinol methylase